MSALIGILCGVAYIGSVRCIVVFGAALQWFWGVGFFIGLLASLLVSMCFYESVAGAMITAAAYTLTSVVGLLACLMVK